MSQYIFRVQIAPVQAFISASRKTSDLYYSSRILSEIARAGVDQALMYGDRVSLIFPAYVSGRLPESIPNVFSFILTAEGDAQAKQAGEQIAAALRGRWRDMGDRVANFLEKMTRRNDWRELFDAQIESYLEVYWVAVPYDTANHAESFRASVAALSARKNLRHIPTGYEGTKSGRKCTLTGAMDALPIDWSRHFEDVEVRANEALGAVAAVKRFARRANVLPGDAKAFDDLDSVANADRSDDPPYVAILHMDGDRMGAHISGLDQTHLTAFTQKLSKFAQTDVPDIFERYQGSALVYSGGDDVLAFVNPQKMLEIAGEIQAKFREMTGRTMSAGIALMPLTYPLDLGLDIARRAEKEAKGRYGRDAVCVIEVHGGQMRQAGAKWSGLDVYDALHAYFRNGKLSGKLGYQLRQMADEMGGTVSREARRLEMRRLLSRRAGNDLNDSEIDALAQKIDHAAESMYDRPATDQNSAEPHQGYIEMANWAILARFLSKRGDQK